MTHYSNDQKASAKARASRIRYVRETVLKLSREQFSLKSKISSSTLQNWEQARNQKGVSEAGAHQLVKAFREEGAECTIEWLLYEVGDKPIAPFSNATMKELLKSPEEEIIHKELKLFHELNPNSIDTVVSDDGMSPIYWIGDYVAGKQYLGQQIKKTVGLPCIVELESHEQLVRMVEEGEKKDTYTLYCINENTAAK